MKAERIGELLGRLIALGVLLAVGKFIGFGYAIILAIWSSTNKITSEIRDK